MPDKRKCFVISPIGEEGSDLRRHADTILELLLIPILKEYEVIRADKIAKPGVITDQIISHILEDDLVIADLSFNNPNVFYELALRHATGKPFIQLTNGESRLPFDVSGLRTIFFSMNVNDFEKAKSELNEQLRTIESSNFAKVDNPIYSSLRIDQLKDNDKLEAILKEAIKANQKLSIIEDIKLTDIEGKLSCLEEVTDDAVSQVAFVIDDAKKEIVSYLDR